MKLVYIAHPCGGGLDRDENRERASRWCAWALLKHDVSPVADWIVLTSQLSEDFRAIGLRANLAVLERCDEIWLVGGRVSPGMKIEADYALSKKIKVVDMTELGKEPPL
jgi:hypothetical protein